ncbi:33 kDa chaperonin [Striga asiatica]|uniref:33 kDa chaperonin n=1 Tax=Striga asiatica TaxID=4170 RepID=A0A5A7QPN6_STRAF|nr:33 kDa chaperonin [Striga asiatica]
MNQPNHQHTEIYSKGIGLLTDRLVDSNPLQSHLQKNPSLVESSSSGQEIQSTNGITHLKETVPTNLGKEIDIAVELGQKEINIGGPLSLMTTVITDFPMDSQQTKLRTWRRTGTKEGMLLKNHSENMIK